MSFRSDFSPHSQVFSGNGDSFTTVNLKFEYLPILNAFKKAFEKSDDGYIWDKYNSSFIRILSSILVKTSRPLTYWNQEQPYYE